MKPKLIDYSDLLFSGEGGRDGVKEILVGAVSKKRKSSSSTFSTRQIDQICGLGEFSPEVATVSLPSWSEIEGNHHLMSGIVFSLVTSLFDIKADKVLKLPTRVNGLTAKDRMAILKEIETIGGFRAAAGGRPGSTVTVEQQIVPFVTIRILDELND